LGSKIYTVPYGGEEKKKTFQQRKVKTRKTVGEKITKRMSDGRADRQPDRAKKQNKTRKTHTHTPGQKEIVVGFSLAA
jgi:hypothetical protein